MKTLVPLVGLAASVLMGGSAFAQQGRIAAFEPITQSKSEERAKVDRGFGPMEERVDVGHIVAGRSRRVSMVFANLSLQPVTIGKVGITADGGISAVVDRDDCSSMSVVESGDRCVVTVQVVPGVLGPWKAELSVMHSGAGRVALVAIGGDSQTTEGTDVRSGLIIEGLQGNRMMFERAVARRDRIARSAIIKNVALTPLQIDSLAVATATDDVSIAEGSCKEGLVLEPNATCPVTVVWGPTRGGLLSTDLIVRHNGSAPPIIVGLRGEAEQGVSEMGLTGTLPPPPAVTGQLASAVPHAVTPSLPLPAPTVSSDAKRSDIADQPSGGLILSGIVGNKVMLKMGSSRAVSAAVGKTVRVGASTVRVLDIGTASVTADVDGTRTTLSLVRRQ